MTAYAYILECRDGSFYVGSTRSLDRRLEQHALGLGSEYTRRRLPVRLVWSCEFENIGAAFALEKQVQGWGRAKRIALIEGRFADLPALARGRTGRPESRASANGVVSTSSTNEGGSTSEGGSVGEGGRVGSSAV